MRAHRFRRRGVSLIEGLVASGILLAGMVGVMQGIIVASRQNSMSARHVRASLVASEMLSGVSRMGFANSDSTIFSNNTRCQATPSTLSTDQTAGLHALPSALSSAVYTACTVDFDALAGADAAVAGLSPAFNLSSNPGEDNALFTRALIFYRNNNSLEATKGLHYLTAVVSWREAGVVRTVVQTGALNDPTINQSFVEL